MVFAQRWNGVHHDLKASTPRRFGVFTAFYLSYCFPEAFARRCHGVYCARAELSLTASSGVFDESR